MSAEIPPDPTTSTFNPSAWNAPALTPEEEAVLDANYIRFPITQNAQITFPIAPIAPTLANGTNTTQVATTGFVQNAITAFLSTIHTWAGTQIFSLGMTSNTINPTTTSGTLIIGNAAVNTNVEVATSATRNVILHLGDGDNNTLNAGIHIGNGATSANNVRILDGAGSTGTIFLGSETSTISLGCPLTPNYATVYSATGTGTGKIGQIIDGTFTGTITPVVADTPYSVGTMTSLPIGVWLIAGSVGRGGAGSYTGIGLNTTSASLVDAISQETMATGSNNAIVSMTSIIVNTAATTYYLIGISSAAGSWASASFFFRAVRIA
jgi:hypothetical protein